MAFGDIGKIVKNVGGGIFNRTLGRLTGAGISTDSRIVNARARWSGRSDKTDWRVRLQIPTGADAVYESILANNDLLNPLVPSRGIFWPLTPAVVIQHSANYNPLAQTHSNYPFQAYQNSQVDSMNIIGEFPVQNSDDAKHWVATVNFLRTITKMYFGKEQALKGNPPPIMHLSGYGDHMFNKIPVIVNTFNVELRPGIDYISTKQGSKGDRMRNDFVSQQQAYLNSGLSYDPYTGRPINIEAARNAITDGNYESQTWAPTLSNISVLVTPVYSRNSIKNFSLSEFARGKLGGKGDGEIGFI
jgi:hypothetical protein